jgi:hypothetical protein
MTRRTILLLSLLALLVASCDSDTDEGRDAEPTAPPGSPMRATGGTASPTAAVRVVLRGIEDQEGELAGLVYKGLWPPASHRAIGGFAVAVDADPFSTTQVVRRPQRVPQPNGMYEGPFPYVLDDVLALKPGTYTLVLVGALHLSPYNRWVPGNRRDLKACKTTFLVGEGGDATVMLTDPVLRHGGGMRDCER